MIFGLNAWQFLLWVAALEMIVAPFVILVVGTIINGYFHAKDQHIGRIAGALGQTLSKAAEDISKKIGIKGGKE